MVRAVFADRPTGTDRFRAGLADVLRVVVPEPVRAVTPRFGTELVRAVRTLDFGFLVDFAFFLFPWVSNVSRIGSPSYSISTLPLASIDLTVIPCCWSFSRNPKNRSTGFCSGCEGGRVMESQTRLSPLFALTPASVILSSFKETVSFSGSSSTLGGAGGAGGATPPAYQLFSALPRIVCLPLFQNVYSIKPSLI